MAWVRAVFHSVELVEGLCPIWGASRYPEVLASILPVSLRWC